MPGLARQSSCAGPPIERDAVTAIRHQETEQGACHRDGRSSTQFDAGPAASRTVAAGRRAEVCEDELLIDHLGVFGREIEQIRFMRTRMTIADRIAADER